MKLCTGLWCYMFRRHVCHEHGNSGVVFTYNLHHKVINFFFFFQNFWSLVDLGDQCYRSWMENLRGLQHLVISKLQGWIDFDQTEKTEKWEGQEGYLLTDVWWNCVHCWVKKKSGSDLGSIWSSCGGTSLARTSFRYIQGSSVVSLSVGASFFSWCHLSPSWQSLSCQAWILARKWWYFP